MTKQQLFKMTRNANQKFVARMRLSEAQRKGYLSGQYSHFVEVNADRFMPADICIEGYSLKVINQQFAVASHRTIWIYEQA